jgi:hypothetical protein
MVIIAHSRQNLSARMRIVGQLFNSASVLPIVESSRRVM